MTKDELIEVFCNESKKNNYKNLVKHALNFFSEHGYNEDKMDREHVYYHIVSKIFTTEDIDSSFHEDLDWIEEYIDKQDRGIFYDFYIDLTDRDFMLCFFDKIQTRRDFERFDEVFGTNITQNGFGEGSEFINAVIRKIVDSESKDLENFLVDIYKQSVPEVTEEDIDIEDTSLADALIEIGYIISLDHECRIDGEYLEEKMEKISPSCPELIELVGKEIGDLYKNKQEDTPSMR